MAKDPFADTPDVPVNNGPVVEQKDNWVSFTFNSGLGYDRIGATVHGDPEFVAEMFGIADFNGKVSSLMKKSVQVDEFFKKQYGGANPGKA